MISKGETRESSVSRSASEALFKSLSQGMHAVAQPLAILRASFGNTYMDRMSAEEMRELAASSALEVERVCALFSCLQQLVRVGSIEPHLSVAPIPPLLAYVVDGVKLLFDEDGIFLHSMVPDTCPPVQMDRTRTLEALSGVLLIAHAVSVAQETVELIASNSAPDVVRVVVRNLHSHFTAINSEQSLSLALAEANIRSQQGTFTWSLDPFNVEIELKST
jgi:hypothetical protein